MQSGQWLGQIRVRAVIQRSSSWPHPSSHLAHVTGLEATSLASKSLDVGDGAEDPNDVIIRHWASSAVAAVHHVKQVKGNSLPKLIEEDVTGLIRGDSWWAREVRKGR